MSRAIIDCAPLSVDMDSFSFAFRAFFCSRPSLFFWGAIVHPKQIIVALNTAATFTPTFFTATHD